MIFEYYNAVIGWQVVRTFISGLRCSVASDEWTVLINVAYVIALLIDIQIKSNNVIVSTYHFKYLSYLQFTIVNTFPTYIVDCWLFWFVDIQVPFTTFCSVRFLFYGPYTGFIHILYIEIHLFMYLSSKLLILFFLLCLYDRFVFTLRN